MAKRWTVAIVLTDSGRFVWWKHSPPSRPIIRETCPDLEALLGSLAQTLQGQSLYRRFTKPKVTVVWPEKIHTCEVGGTVMPTMGEERLKALADEKHIIFRPVDARLVCQKISRLEERIASLEREVKKRDERISFLSGQLGIAG